MDEKQLFQKSTARAYSCVAHIQSPQLVNRTPCRKWDLRALLNHMVYELLWVPEIINGKTIAEVGSRFDGDVLGQDFLDTFRLAVVKADEAVKDADLTELAHLSYGDVAIGQYILDCGSDIMIHTWDVGQSIGSTVIFDPVMAQTVYDHSLPRAEEFRLSGLYDTPLGVSQDADIQTKLLAFFGRKVTEHV